MQKILLSKLLWRTLIWEPPKPFGKLFIAWHTILKNNKSNTPSSLLVNDKTVTDEKDIAKQFNRFLTSIGIDLQKYILPTEKKL